MALFDSIIKQLSALGDERAQMFIKLEKARQRHMYLQTAQLPKDEYIDKLLRLVDVNASYFSDDLQRRTAAFTNRPLTEINPLTSLLTDGQNVGGQALERMLCGLFTDQVKEGIRQTVRSWDWPKAGPPLREREAEIIKLEKTIADLEDKLKELDSLANQTGIEIGQARGDQIKHQGLGRAPNQLRKGN